MIIPQNLFEFSRFLVLGSLAAPAAIFGQLELVGGIGFVFFGQIILSSADRAK